MLSISILQTTERSLEQEAALINRQQTRKVKKEENLQLTSNNNNMRVAAETSRQRETNRNLEPSETEETSQTNQTAGAEIRNMEPPEVEETSQTSQTAGVETTIRTEKSERSRWVTHIHINFFSLFLSYNIYYRKPAAVTGKSAAEVGMTGGRKKTARSQDMEIRGAARNDASSNNKNNNKDPPSLKHVFQFLVIFLSYRIFLYLIVRTFI